MKHLKTLLNLLFFPFVFLMHFSLFANFRTYLLRISLILIAIISTPAYLYAEGGGGGGGGGTPPSSNNPTVWITPTSKSITEGNSGTKTVKVYIKIDKCPDTADIKVEWKTHSGSAKHWGTKDYQWGRNYITFKKDSCNKSQSASVTVYGDTHIENNENFTIRIKNKGTSSSQDFKWGQQRTTVTINNDDAGADLRMRKSANKDFYSKGNTVTYTLRARNLGPSASKIRVVDSLPAGLSFISVSDNKSSFSCSQSGGTITCGGSRNFTKNQEVKITIRAKVTADGYASIKNTATVDSPNGVTDPNTSNNTDSDTIHVNVPGGRDDVDVVKTVDDDEPKVGDTVNFTVKITNLGLNKRIAIRDKFPLTGDDWSTTGGAFELVSYTSPADVTCDELTHSGNPYLFCYTAGNYAHGESFTVNIRAKVKKRGYICNTAHGYKYHWSWMDSDKICLDATGTYAPVINFPDISKELFSSVSFNLQSYTSDADGDTNFSYSNISGLPPGISMSPTGHISGILTEDSAATYPQVYDVSVTVTDSDGHNGYGTSRITVTIPDLKATDNEYSEDAGKEINGNFIVDDTGAGVDTGWRIKWESCSNPTSGTVTCSPDGNFTYVPSVNTSMTDYFSYTISDKSGNEDTATVILRLGDGGFSNQDEDFVRINPTDTWNIIGDYLVVGNTVQCITNKRGTSGESNPFDGTCQDGSGFYNNEYMSKYIDVDGDSSTWNSSSANFTLPDTYDDSASNGVLWAGLFWQGAAHHSNSGFKQRRAKPHGAGFNYTNITSNQPYNIVSSPAKNISIKIGAGSYTSVIANRLNYDEEHGSFGGYYAAFADITSIIQGQNLAKGTHTVTVANITSTEGREDGVGNYGGWSLAIIYKDDPDNEQSIPRNISIYQGFKVINGNGTVPTPGRIHEIDIAGFKLPEEGSIEAKLSVFAGEGEEKFGLGVNQFDKVLLKRTATSPEKNIPNIADASNIFDAHLAGISRDTSNNNNVVNTNGVDVDDYNVSSVLETFRDEDENINSLKIKMSSNDDYVLINMLGFSAELYVPELCYDYTLDIDGHVLDSVNNEIRTPFGGFGADLTTVIYLRSLDGDIPLGDVDIKYTIDDTSQLQYDHVNCSTEISETGEYDYSDACPYTHSASNAGFGMYVGTGKTGSDGGTIAANEERYIKFDTEFKGSTISTGFSFKVDYTVDFGSGKAELGKEFHAADLCEPVNDGFFPTLGSFNITGTGTHDKWNLYTQTSGRDFNLTLFAYDANNPTQAIGNDLNLSVEIEMIRADNFSREADTACNDEHSYLSDVERKFVHFNQSKGEGFGYVGSEINLAYRNTAMRVWYLSSADGNGTLIDNHNCTRINQAECEELYTRDYASGGECAIECTSPATGNCYDCLRSNYGRKVCSRDNFVIRPESFVTQIIDSNQSADTTKASNNIADSTSTSAEFAVVAGYNYRFDINATNHLNDIATPRYLQHFEPGSNIHRVSMEWFPDGHTVSNCNETDDKNISLNIVNGSSVNLYENTSYVDKVEQIGKYRFFVYDQNWTSADWDDDQMAHHSLDESSTGGLNYAGYYVAGDDCIYGISTVYGIENPIINPRPGCEINSVHTNADTGVSYDYLYARYYPYTFDVSGLNRIGGGPQNNNNIVYINTLDRTLYPNGIDENMSFNIQGTFFAAGYEGDMVSNFVKNCYADNVDMTLNHTYLSDIPANEVTLKADLIDHNTSNPSLTYPNDDPSDRRREVFSYTPAKDTISPLSITQTKNLFAKDMQGAISMDLGFNFDRTNNQKLNPRKINFSDFNITYDTATEPATVFVDLIEDYKIYGDIDDIDQNITFMYARAKPAKVFYDDILTSPASTPVSVEVFCDKDYTECQERGIMALFAQTNEYNWWKSWDHSSANGDGNIELVSNPSGALNSSSASIASEGEDASITVSGTIPSTVSVSFVEYSDPALPYTDRWLIFNPENALLAPTPFFRVRFVDPATWVGHGETGHVVGGDSNRQKNRRLGW